MQAFKNNSALKQLVINQIGLHEKADAIVQRSYGEYFNMGDPAFKGCAVGCTINSLFNIGQVDNRSGMRKRLPDLKQSTTATHELYQSKLGIPIELAYLEDILFEHADPEVAKHWPRRFLESIPVGADLSNVYNNVFVRVYAEKHDMDVKTACRQLSNVDNEEFMTYNVPSNEFTYVDMLGDFDWVTKDYAENLSAERIMDILIEEITNASVQ